MRAGLHRYLMRLEEARSICLRRFVLTSNSSTTVAVAAAPASPSTSTTSVVLINNPRDLANTGEESARPLPEDAEEGAAADPAGVDADLCRWWPRRVGAMDDDGCTMKPAAEHRHAANTTEAAARRGLQFAIVPHWGRALSLSLSVALAFLPAGLV